MKKLLSLSLIAVSSLMLLTACDKQTKEEDKIEYTPPMFELAENDVKLYDYIEYNKNNWNDNENSGGGTNNKVPQYDSSEITIENSDESVDFIIDGSNILYKGKIFNGLYDVVQQLELPCSQTTFINFIVKTYKNNGSNNIYTECFLDSENYEE